MDAGPRERPSRAQRILLGETASCGGEIFVSFYCSLSLLLLLMMFRFLWSVADVSLLVLRFVAFLGAVHGDVDVTTCCFCWCCTR